MSPLPNQLPSNVNRTAVVPQEVSPYDKDRARTLGICQLFLGCICIVIESTFIASPSFMYFPIATGIWTGVLHLASATTTLLSSRVASKCSVISSMVFSIISCVAAFIGFMLGVIAIFAIKSSYSFYSSYGIDGACSNPTPESSHIDHIPISLAQITQAFVALVTSGFCCRGTCCGNRASRLAQQPATSPDVVLHPDVVYHRGRYLPSPSAPGPRPPVPGERPGPLPPPRDRPPLYQETEYTHDGYIQSRGAGEREEERNRERGYWVPGDTEEYEQISHTGDTGSYITMEK